jgi:hypothetical protein
MCKSIFEMMLIQKGKLMEISMEEYKIVQILWNYKRNITEHRDPKTTICKYILI